MTTARLIFKDKKDSKTDSLIYLLIRHNGVRRKYSTGEKAIPYIYEFIDNKLVPKDLKAKVPKVIKEVNSQISRYQIKFEQYLSNCKLNEEEFILDKFIAHLDSKFKSSSKVGKEFLEFTEEHIVSCNKALETRKGYKTTLNILKKYKSEKKSKLNYNDVDLNFYQNFISWCEEKPLALNTIGGHIKNIKVFMDVAYQKKFHTNDFYRNKLFKIMEEQTPAIYLDTSEIVWILELDLTSQPRLEKVRDAFILACRTGLRFSDLKRLTVDHIEQNLFRIRTNKTSEEVFIPIHADVRALIKKYDNQLPKIPSHQKFNVYVKEICELAKISNPVIITRTVGGQKKDFKFKKHELVSAHSARRTFASIAYKEGMPSISIRKITGHRSERTFQNYIKLSAEEHAQLLATHSFFK